MRSAPYPPAETNSAIVSSSATPSAPIEEAPMALRKLAKVASAVAAFEVKNAITGAI